MIDDVFSANTGLGSIESARSIYLALAEIASDFERDDNLDVSQAAIARRACVGLTTTKLILPVFERIGLIKVKRNSFNGMKTRSTYTLVRGKLPIANKRLTIAGETANSPAISEECSEEPIEAEGARNNNKCRNKECGISLSVGGGNSETETGASVFNKETGEYDW